MAELIVSTLIISLLHALIPSHWMPLVTISKILKWNHAKTLRATFIVALSHCLSTILLGLVIAFAGNYFVNHFSAFTEYIAPAILVFMGVWFLIRHHRHKHFHLHLDENLSFANERKLMVTIILTMFLSPCLEIEAVFASAGTQGWLLVAIISGVYILFTIGGMMLWMQLALHGLQKINSHRIEHNAGLISGIVLIITGLLTYFIH